MIEAITHFYVSARTGWQVFQTLRKSKRESEIKYFMGERCGVPQTVILIGKGREAWRVADFAANARSLRP